MHRAPAVTRIRIMIWLVLLAGIQILGFGLTLARLAYDEWRQRQSAGKMPSAVEDRHGKLEFEPCRTVATM